MRVRSNLDWEFSSRDDAIIKDLYPHPKCTPAKEIATILNRTVTSIQSRVNQLGLQRRKNRLFTPNDDAEITKLFLEYTPVDEIAHKTRRTVSAVRKRAFDLGLRRNRNKTTLLMKCGIEGKILTDEYETIKTKHENDHRIAEINEKQRVSDVLFEMERRLVVGVERKDAFTWALQQGATLEGVGQRVSLTRERIRQIVYADDR